MAARICGVGRVTVSERRSTPCCVPASRITAGRSSLAQHLCDEEGQLQGLLVVQPRSAERLVPRRQPGVVDLLGSAEALGDVVTGELQVKAPASGAEGRVHLE